MEEEEEEEEGIYPSYDPYNSASKPPCAW